MQSCRVLPCAGYPAVAGHMHEANSVRHVSGPVGDQVVPGDRFAGGGEPLFPLAWAAWLPVGVQQVVRAYWAAAFLLPDQAQGAVVQRGFAPAPPVGPVRGDSLVIRGGRSMQHAVTDDFRASEIGQGGFPDEAPEYPAGLPGGA